MYDIIYYIIKKKHTIYLKHRFKVVWKLFFTLDGQISLESKTP